jgi:hypothetical protein
MLSGEATNTNFIVFGLTQPGLEPTIYHTRGEHANHYTTDAIKKICLIYCKILITFTMLSNLCMPIHLIKCVDWIAPCGPIIDIIKYFDTNNRGHKSSLRYITYWWTISRVGLARLKMFWRWHLNPDVESQHRYESKYFHEKRFK